MKKLVTLAVVAIAVVGSAVAQMAIPGEIFAGNPARFNGRKVTLKNIELVKADLNPDKWVPPSFVRMLLAKVTTCSS